MQIWNWISTKRQFNYVQKFFFLAVVLHKQTEISLQSDFVNKFISYLK